MRQPECVGHDANIIVGFTIDLLRLPGYLPIVSLVTNHVHCVDYLMAGIGKPDTSEDYTDTETRPAEQRRSAAHVPFLSHTGPPPGASIRIDGLANEYRVVVRLPGFRRDAM